MKALRTFSHYPRNCCPFHSRPYGQSALAMFSTGVELGSLLFRSPSPTGPTQWWETSVETLVQDGNVVEGFRVSSFHSSRKSEDPLDQSHHYSVCSSVLQYCRLTEPLGGTCSVSLAVILSFLAVVDVLASERRAL